MRLFTSALLFGVTLAALGAFNAFVSNAFVSDAFVSNAFISNAFAQSGYVHHNFCLLTGPARECAYETMAQCLAAKRGNADFCEPNDAPLNHAPGRYQYQ
ncbi:MAG TPA: hypothetical protein VMA30_21035 [Xanthobacteraceae bacterium]|nr:hypothetical protein [Xanthobacteraceae bacterium]